jgi:cytochrome o ubiquinol oxidase subunit 2
MNRKYKFLVAILLLAAIITLAVIYFSSVNISVLDPKGTIGQQEKHLMLFALGLSLVVVIPVFTLLFSFAWRYRASNHRYKNRKYSPDWDHSVTLETIWWLIPTVLIAILSVTAWNSSHQLDPYRSLASDKQPLTIQVVALDWKWLFIYPQENIASVNYVQFPVNQPVNFQITADAPMNSFWIPQLGGQIYAMPGMATDLHLSANQIGNYNGSSANISGTGFAGMRFTAKASSATDFDQWVATARHSPNHLTFNSYDKLAQASQNNPAAAYASTEPGLFDIIIMKYMEPLQGINDTTSDAPGHIVSATSLGTQ